MGAGHLNIRWTVKMADEIHVITRTRARPARHHDMSDQERKELTEKVRAAHAGEGGERVPHLTAYAGGGDSHLEVPEPCCVG